MMQTLTAVFAAGPRPQLQIGTGLAPAAEAPAASLPSSATAVEAVQPPLSPHGDTRRSFGDHVGSSLSFVWLLLLVLAVVSALAVRAGLPRALLRVPAVSPREAADASTGVVTNEGAASPDDSLAAQSRLSRHRNVRSAHSVSLEEVWRGRAE